MRNEVKGGKMSNKKTHSQKKRQNKKNKRTLNSKKKLKQKNQIPNIQSNIQKAQKLATHIVHEELIYKSLIEIDEELVITMKDLKEDSEDLYLQGKKTKLNISKAELQSQLKKDKKAIKYISEFLTKNSSTTLDLIDGMVKQIKERIEKDKRDLTKEEK